MGSPETEFGTRYGAIADFIAGMAAVQEDSFPTGGTQAGQANRIILGAQNVQLSFYDQAQATKPHHRSRIDREFDTGFYYQSAVYEIGTFFGA